MQSLSSVATAVAALSWIVVGSAAPLQVRQSDYPWLSQASVTETLASRIPVPPGFERESVSSGSFAEWLRNLPIKKGRPPVYLYNGLLKANQNAHAAVVDIDTGNKDLQQCADAVIRLRAEYLYSKHDIAGIHFDFTSGDTAHFKKWAEGFRPIVQGNRVSWDKSAPPIRPIEASAPISILFSRTREPRPWSANYKPCRMFAPCAPATSSSSPAILATPYSWWTLQGILVPDAGSFFSRKVTCQPRTFISCRTLQVGRWVRGMTRTSGRL